MTLNTSISAVNALVHEW